MSLGASRPVTRRILARVGAALRELSLLEPRPLLLVAASGGQDSVCLLDALVAWREQLRLDLHAVHVNHQLRGRAADEDARFVVDLAAGYGLACTVLTLDVAAYRRRHALSTQVAARYARYQAIAALARRLGSPLLVVGHTRDDLAETVLLNLLRGAGPRGLAAMRQRQELPLALLGPPLAPGDLLSSSELCPPTDSLDLLRPLLDIDRVETAAYCAERGLPVRADSSNAQQRYARNRVRLSLLPILEQFNPRVRAALARTARLAADDLEIVEQEVERAWRRVASMEPGAVAFDRRAFAGESNAMRRHLLRRAAEALRGTAQGLTWASIRRASDLVASGRASGHMRLPGGVWLRCSYGRCILSPTGAERPVSSLPEEPSLLPFPGSLRLPGVGRLQAEIVDGPPSPQQLRASPSPLRAWADLDRLQAPVLVRRRRLGDRMRPLGLGHVRKVQDILVDARVPRHLRDSVPVLTSGDQIVWLAGVRMDERFRLDDATRRAVLFTFELDGALAEALGWPPTAWERREDA